LAGAKDSDIMTVVNSGVMDFSSRIDFKNLMSSCPRFFYLSSPSCFSVAETGFQGCPATIMGFGSTGMNRPTLWFSMQKITMQKPTQKKSNRQCKKYQQCARHRGSPEQKADLDHSDILCDKDHRQTGENQDQRQFQVHIPIPSWKGSLTDSLCVAWGII